MSELVGDRIGFAPAKAKTDNDSDVDQQIYRTRPSKQRGESSRLSS
jgi:hypothetical protein